MATMARRAALKMLAAIPIAGPVAAKEAAAKMGVGSLLSGAQGARRGTSLGGGECVDVPRALSAKERVTSYLDELSWWQGDERRKAMRSQYRRQPINLDPDLASMNSLSPSAARSLQIERLVDQEVGENVSRIQKWIAEIVDGK